MASVVLRFRAVLRYGLATIKLSERKGKARKRPPFPMRSNQRLGNESCSAEQGGLQSPCFPSWRACPSGLLC